MTEPKFADALPGLIVFNISNLLKATEETGSTELLIKGLWSFADNDESFGKFEKALADMPNSRGKKAIIDAVSAMHPELAGFMRPVGSAAATSLGVYASGHTGGQARDAIARGSDREEAGYAEEKDSYTPG